MTLIEIPDAPVAEIPPARSTSIEAAGGEGATAESWTPICSLDRLTPNRGVAALVDETAIAVFRLPGDDLFAIAAVDPFSGAGVLSRGIVGDAEGVPTVASPLYKQRFDLRTGQCLDDPDVRVETFQARVVDDVVELSSRPRVLAGTVPGGRAPS